LHVKQYKDVIDIIYTVMSETEAISVAELNKRIKAFRSEVIDG